MTTDRSKSSQDPTRGLTLLFGFYAFAFLALAVVVVNPAVLLLFSVDGILSDSTRQRITFIRGGFLIAMVVAAGISLLFARRHKRKADMPRPLAGIIISLSFLLFFVLSTEGLLAIRFPPSYLPSHSTAPPLALLDPHLGYRLNPAYQDAYRINPQGFRGPDWEYSASCKTVFCAGDSITFGLELNDEESTYPARLQRLFDSKCTNGVKVLNAGVPGYASLNALRMIEQQIIPLDPDAILLCIGWNDLIPAITPNWEPNALVTDIQRPVNNSPLALLRFAGEFRRNIRPGRQTGGGHFVRNESAGPVSEKLVHPRAIEQFNTNLERVISLCEANHVPLMLLNMPTLVSDGQMTVEEQSLSAPFTAEVVRPFETVIMDVTRAHDVSASLDLFNLGENRKAAYFWDHCHLTEPGAILFAEKVFQAFLSKPEFNDLCESGPE